MTAPAAWTTAALLCAGCRHPVRRHASGGCGLTDCWCEIEGDGHAPAATPPAPPATPASAAAPAPAAAPAAPRVVDAPARRARTALKAPRRTTPRPAAERALVPAAVVGGDDAVEEVAAEACGVSGAAATSVEPAAAVPRAVAALDEAAALVQQVLDGALFVSHRWYCGSCVAWHGAQGACSACGEPLQPVYLATLPRSIP